MNMLCWLILTVWYLCMYWSCPPRPPWLLTLGVLLPLSGGDDVSNEDADGMTGGATGWPPGSGRPLLGGGWGGIGPPPAMTTEEDWLPNEEAAVEVAAPPAAVCWSRRFICSTDPTRDSSSSARCSVVIFSSWISLKQGHSESIILRFLFWNNHNFGS